MTSKCMHGRVDGECSLCEKRQRESAIIQSIASRPINTNKAIERPTNTSEAIESRPVPLKCIRCKDCLGCGSCRGLCSRCYTVYRLLVAYKKTTWQQLEQEGKCLPATKRYGQ